MELEKNPFCSLDIKDFAIHASEEIAYNDFIQELNQLDSERKPFLAFEETAMKYIKFKVDKIIKQVRELSSYYYWTYHLHKAGSHSY